MIASWYIFTTNQEKKYNCCFICANLSDKFLSGLNLKALSNFKVHYRFLTCMNINHLSSQEKHCQLEAPPLTSQGHIFSRLNPLVPLLVSLIAGSPNALVTLVRGGWPIERCNCILKGVHFGSKKCVPLSREQLQWANARGSRGLKKSNIQNMGHACVALTSPSR